MTEELTPQDAGILFLMALAAFLLSLLAYREGNVWGVIGLALVPVCAVMLVALILYELR